MEFKLVLEQIYKQDVKDTYFKLQLTFFEYKQKTMTTSQCLKISQTLLICTLIVWLYIQLYILRQYGHLKNQTYQKACHRRKIFIGRWAYICAIHRVNVYRSIVSLYIYRMRNIVSASMCYIIQYYFVFTPQFNSFTYRDTLETLYTLVQQQYKALNGIL